MSIDVFVTAHWRNIPRCKARAAKHIIRNAVLMVRLGTQWVCYRLCVVWEPGAVAEFLRLESPLHKYHKYCELCPGTVRVQATFFLDKIDWRSQHFFFCFAHSLRWLAGAPRANGWHGCHSVYERNSAQWVPGMHSISLKNLEFWWHWLATCTRRALHLHLLGWFLSRGAQLYDKGQRALRL